MTLAEKLVVMAVLMAVGSATILVVLHRRDRNRPAPQPVRLNPREGPTLPFAAHPGDPARFRRSRLYRRTGAGRVPVPYRRRSDDT